MTEKTAADWAKMNDPVIADFQATGGTSNRRKRPVILLTTTGAKSGIRRVTPLYFSLDGDRLP